MSFLTDSELDELRVSRMIIHVVGRQNGVFEPQPEIEVQQEAFFRARIIDEAADGVHSFDEDSAVKRVLEVMSRGDMTFQAGGQNLAQRFFEMHVKQSVAGAFFVLELQTGDKECNLYALIKYDYREAVELAQSGGRSVLRAIVQAFVKDRRAVQKICLVRVRNGVAERVVSASDRMKEAPDLTDYFERYLGVSRSRSTAELSQKLNEALRYSMEEIRQHLPSEDVGTAVARAKTALQGRATVSNEDVVDAVLHAADRPADEQVRADIENVIRRGLRRHKLQDVEFRPDRRTLQVMPRRVVRTAEEVRLEFPYEELGHSVTREDTADGVTFTIHTSRLIQDGTLPDKAR
ncbi:nucleoid-associated protein [Sinorhizobium meliloti]|uniref:nucleoid-associated protein n=1 Tax=Rhizobium meliloti TaxID=382 RepID=UPI003D6613EF